MSEGKLGEGPRSAGVWGGAAGFKQAGQGRSSEGNICAEALGLRGRVWRLVIGTKG